MAKLRVGWLAGWLAAVRTILPLRELIKISPVADGGSVTVGGRSLPTRGVRLQLGGCFRTPELARPVRSRLEYARTA
jgi:hypothetical protein